MILNRPSEFQSLDDLLNATYSDILQNGVLIKSKRGANLEIIQFVATLLNPRVRTSLSLDRKLVKSKFAEFAWYLSKDSDKNFINPYISDYDQEEQENDKILGGYGPKIFSLIDGKKSQYERVIEQIVKRSTTKQAYLAISDSEDYKFRPEKHASPPCTIGLHFYVRNEKLNLTVYMRSNDAYLGLPHDLFCFTMLQELVSLGTNFPLGVYTHCVTSMHVYEKHKGKIEDYLKEGFHEPVEMPFMVDGSGEVLDLVSREFDPNVEKSNLQELNEYWKDYSLFSHKHSKNRDKESWKELFKNETMKLIATNSIIQ
jgi:thymidylate synthase